MKKTCNKLLAFVLALAMALSVSVVAFASETTAPTSSTDVSTLDGIASVNVEGVDAYYQYDDNTGSSVKYIRAKLGATKTWGKPSVCPRGDHDHRCRTCCGRCYRDLFHWE
ncbi:MAG: acid shock protein [Lachnospiraceae bacterium]